VSAGQGKPSESSWYARELAATREVLDTVEVAGFPKLGAELAELKRLIERYPTEAADYLRAAKP
jgi:hypothetical protein